MTLTPGAALPYAVTLRVYDSSGLLVRELSAGRAAGPLPAFDASPLPFDPGVAPLTLSQGSWSFSFDGKDPTGAFLRNGSFLLVVESRAGGSVSLSQKQVMVLRTPASAVALSAGPNPVLAGAFGVRLYWSPAVAVELRVYDLAGGLILDLGLVDGGAARWDLKTAGGQTAANGIYWVMARLPGQRTAQVFKLLVAR